MIPAERAYVDGSVGPADPPVVRERGRLDWAGLTALLRGAAVYVGPDTSMTHLAAGSGCPTIALYGPTSPRLIGPWPVGGLVRAMGSRRHDPAARQCLGGAEPAALPAVREARL